MAATCGQSQSDAPSARLRWSAARRCAGGPVISRLDLAEVADAASRRLITTSTFSARRSTSSRMCGEKRIVQTSPACAAASHNHLRAGAGRWLTARRGSARRGRGTSAAATSARCDRSPSSSPPIPVLRVLQLDEGERRLRGLVRSGSRAGGLGKRESRGLRGRSRRPRAPASRRGGTSPFAPGGRAEHPDGPRTVAGTPHHVQQRALAAPLGPSSPGGSRAGSTRTRCR